MLESQMNPLCPKCDSRKNVHRVIGPRLEDVNKAWNCLTCEHRWLATTSKENPPHRPTAEAKG